MTTYEVFHLWSISLISVASLIAILWSLYTINRERGWNTTNVTLNGASSQRFDWALIKEIGSKTIDFSGRLILIANTIGFPMFNKWVLGEQIGPGGNIAVVGLLLFDAIGSLYKSIKDESQKRET